MQIPEGPPMAWQQKFGGQLKVGYPQRRKQPPSTHPEGPGQSVSFTQAQLPPFFRGSQDPLQHCESALQWLPMGLHEQTRVGPDAGVHVPEEQLCPAEQQLRAEPVPHGVLPAGQPQKPTVLSTHGTPAGQHPLPQGVVPVGQQQEVAGSVQVPLQQPVPQRVWPAAHPHVLVLALAHATPAGQHVVPHVVWPAAHAASPRNGLRATAATAPTTLPPIIFSARRLGVGCASSRVSSSKPTLHHPPPQRRSYYRTGDRERWRVGVHA